jgi:hypothetical protein
MPNEYYDQFMELQEESTFRGQTWFGQRSDLVEEYSWAVPTEEVIKYIAAFDEEIIEVGAGNGYWASLIEEYGGSVKAIDQDPPDNTYTEVESGLCIDYDDEYEGKPTLMVWPPYDDGMAEFVVRQGPSHVLYVGEKRGGCTAGDGFFDIIDEKYGLVGKIDIPSYKGVHDNFYHYVRKV